MIRDQVSRLNRPGIEKEERREIMEWVSRQVRELQDDRLAKGGDDQRIREFYDAYFSTLVWLSHMEDHAISGTEDSDCPSLGVEREAVLDGSDRVVAMKMFAEVRDRLKRGGPGSAVVMGAEVDEYDVGETLMVMMLVTGDGALTILGQRQSRLERDMERMAREIMVHGGVDTRDWSVVVQIDGFCEPVEGWLDVKIEHRDSKKGDRNKPEFQA